MALIDKLKTLRMKISRFDVNSVFPEDYSEDVCYVEFGQQLILREILKMASQLELFTFQFLKIIALDEFVDIDDDDDYERKEAMETLIAKIHTVDPFSDIFWKLPKEFILVSKIVAEYPQPLYVKSVKLLSELAWKYETLGGNCLILKRNLAEACSKMYFTESIKSNLSPGIGPQTKRRERGDAVMFGTKPTKGMDVSIYTERGSKLLYVAETLYCTTYNISENRNDYIHAYRTFRRCVRVRKRFGLTSDMVKCFIAKDKEMLKLSLNQMGARSDDLELRKYEVENRAEQQHRNLKYKTIVIDRDNDA